MMLQKSLTGRQRHFWTEVSAHGVNGDPDHEAPSNAGNGN
jgi:hypothetical protein